MKFSVITINLNNKAGLTKTIESVIHQTYTDFEYIVIDGDSRDGSKAVIQQYQDKIDYWVSEPDTGIYQAMNKGIKVAQGEFLLFLNSGDCLVSDKILEAVAESIMVPSKADIYSGDLYLSNKKTDKLIESPTEVTFSHLVSSYIPHPSTFISRRLFKKFGLYNEDLKIVSDWAFFLKVLGLYETKYQKIDFPISIFAAGGLSSRPEMSQLIREEKEKVLHAFFPSRISDHIIAYSEIANILANKRFRFLLIIEKIPILRWICSIFLYFLVLPLRGFKVSSRP